jgi:outer membrane lipase/esterase
MKLTHSAGLAALCAAVFGIATQASAQQYTRVVAFGDSLTDNGNIAVLAGPAYAPPPPYYGYRYSNGPTFVENLGALGLPTTLGHFGTVTGSTDFAVGGAETGTGNYGSPLLPGMSQEVAAYVGGGGAFGAHDLVTVWGGANDLFANFIPASTNANPTGYISTVGVTAAGNISGYVNQFATAGAGTIVVPNLPNLATTPQFTGSPAAPLALTGTNAFNAALLSNLQADAKLHPHTNIVLIDTNAAVTYIQTHGAQFGFTNTSQACVSVPACVGAGAATQNTYAFWDGVHPTEATHQLLANLIIDSVTYGDRGASMGIETETGVRHRTQSYDTALETLQHRDFANDKSGVGVSLEYADAQIDARALAASTKDSGETLRINIDGVASPTLRFGGQFGFTNAEVAAGPLRFRTQSVGADGLVGWRSGRYFVNGVAGISLDNDQDIRRTTAVTQVANTGATQGWSGGAKVQAGAWFELGQHWTVSPRAAIAYTRGVVDAYTEVGPFDRYQYGDSHIGATTAEGTVRLSGPLGGGLWAHLEGGYRDYISYDSTVSTTLAANVAQTLSRSLGEPDAGLGLVDAGIGGKLMTASWNLGYRGRFGGGYTESLAHANVTLSF